MNEQEVKRLLEEALENNNKAWEEKFNYLERQIDTINKFVSAITESQSIETAMSEIESVAKQLSGCDEATFYCYDNSGDKFFANGDYREWQNTQSAAELKQAFIAQKIRSKDDKAIIPIVTSKGKSMGVIVAKKESGFKPKDLEGFKKNGQMMNTVELALKKEFEHQGRITDELTQLKNRQGLNEYLANTVCGNLNDGRKICVIMCDIDHFKEINDTYGHDAGDTILRNVAAVLNEGTRDGADCAFRFGGEEMLCILNCDPEKAVDIAERLREQIENMQSSVMKNGVQESVKVTVSMGVSEFSPTREVTPANARYIFDKEIKSADNALYEAKESGRNKVVAADHNVYIAYLALKAAELVCTENPPLVPTMKNTMLSCLRDNNDVGTVVEALQAFAEENPQYYEETEKLLAKIESAFSAPQRSEAVYEKEITQNDEQTKSAEGENGVKYYNKAAYNGIENKEYLHVNASIAYKIAQKATAENVDFSVKYDGNKSVVTVDGVKDKAFVEAVRNEFMTNKPQIFHTPAENQGITYTDIPVEKAPKSDTVIHKKQPTFYNKEGYDAIENKTYIQTDSKTAYQISKAAEKQGVETSAIYNGEKSVVTIDGIKNSKFLSTVKRMSEWADKVQIKTAQIKQQRDQKQKAAGAR